MSAFGGITVWPAINLSVCLSAYVAVSLSVCGSMCLSVFLSVCKYERFLFFNLYVQYLHCRSALPQPLSLRMWDSGI